MLDGFITLLKTDPGIEALVADRVYQQVLARGYKFPAIVIHRYGGTQDYDLAGPVGIREDLIQVDTYSGAADNQPLTEAVRSLLVGFVGTLPDNTVVQACYLERDMDMPYLPDANSIGIANRSSLGFRVVSVRS